MKYVLAILVTVTLVYAGTFNPGDSEGTLGTGNMDTTADTCVDVSTLQYIGLQFQHTGADAVDATLDIKGSVRANASAAADYDTYPDASQSITVSAAGSKWWDIDTRSLGKLCVVYTSGSNTSGTYIIYFRKEVPTK